MPGKLHSISLRQVVYVWQLINRLNQQNYFHVVNEVHLCSKIYFYHVAISRDITSWLFCFRFDLDLFLNKLILIATVKPRLRNSNVNFHKYFYVNLIRYFNIFFTFWSVETLRWLFENCKNNLSQMNLKVITQMATFCKTHIVTN